MKVTEKQNEDGKRIAELISEIKKATGLTQAQIAKRINYEREYLSQAKKDGSEPLYLKLKDTFRKELEKSNIPQEQNGKKEEHIPKVIQAEQTVFSAAEVKQYFERLVASAEKLADSNKSLADSNKSLADSNKSLADGNIISSKTIDRLSAMLEHFLPRESTMELAPPGTPGLHMMERKG